jgi:rSAM/selenodomain-associated transferase 2
MISVVIPALNEEENISRCIAALRTGGPECEIIVADGGSRDRTREVAESYAGVTCIQTEKGRGNQMNAGASHAQGDVLLFLHADTILATGWDRAIEADLRNNRVVGGAFTFAIDSPLRQYRIIEAWVSMRCRVFSLPYGDQAIFVRSGVFKKLTGYKNIPLMEDVDFIGRMKKLGRITILKHRALTSGRRWAANGLIRTAAVNQAVMLLYRLGVSAQRLAKLYYR